MPPAIPFAAIHAWLFDAALPLWARIGVNPARRCFVEKVDFTGAPVECGLLRTRVAGRQTYVFSHALELGWAPGEATSAFGADLLLRLYQGPDRGWPRTVSAEGVPLDPTPDLYDLAFVLFGFAWRYRVAKDPRARAGANQVLDFIEHRLRAPHGYWHRWPPEGPRLQNPHMHLLEACLAAYEAKAGQRFLDAARALVTLFRERLFDGRTLAEFFDADWARAPSDPGRLIEPGHQFEWAWILIRYGQLAGEDTTALAEALLTFAETCGCDTGTGRVFQIVRDDGVPVDASSRAWPNAERIKAHLALFEATGRDPRAAVSQSAHVLLDHYLATDTQGLWIDHLDAQGRPCADSVPASTLYHVHLAFAEVLRLEPALKALE